MCKEEAAKKKRESKWHASGLWTTPSRDWEIHLPTRCFLSRAVWRGGEDRRLVHTCGCRLEFIFESCMYVLHPHCSLARSSSPCGSDQATYTLGPDTVKDSGVSCLLPQPGSHKPSEAVTSVLQPRALQGMLGTGWPWPLPTLGRESSPTDMGMPAPWKEEPILGLSFNSRFSLLCTKHGKWKSTRRSPDWVAQLVRASS